MSSREARPGSARHTGAQNRTRSPRPGERPGSGRAPSARRAPGATSGRGADGAARRDVVVVGPVPPMARAAGILLVLSGLTGAVAPFLPYLVVGGRRITVAGGLGTLLVAWVIPVAALAVGAVLVRGRVPKLGLAYAAVGGALAVGRLLIVLYRGRTSTARPAVEVIAGQRVLTSSVEVRAGWVLGVIALSLAVLAGCCAAVAWGRTVMEDSGGLDRFRGSLAGAAVMLGVLTVLCLVLPAADMPEHLVTDPSTGMETVVTQEGPQALLDRPGLALLGGLLLAGAVVLCSVVAPSLRPRLATVGGLLALAVTVLAAALEGLRDAVVSPDLQWTVPGAGLLVAGAGYALLTVLAWRLRAGAPEPVRS